VAGEAIRRLKKSAAPKTSQGRFNIQPPVIITTFTGDLQGKIEIA